MSSNRVIILLTIRFILRTTVSSPLLLSQGVPVLITIIIAIGIVMYTMDISTAKEARKVN